MPWSGSDVIHHIRLSKLSIKSSHWTISTSNAIFHLSSGIFSNGRCNDYGGMPGALLHRAGFGLTHQSYAFWFGDCDGQDLSWPIIPTGCACTLKIVRLAAHVYLYCMESLEGLRAEPNGIYPAISNILYSLMRDRQRAPAASGGPSSPHLQAGLTSGPQVLPCILRRYRLRFVFSEQLATTSMESSR